MSVVAVSARRTPLASARSGPSPSPRAGSARGQAPPPPAKIPLLLLANNNQSTTTTTALHRGLPAPQKVPLLAMANIFAPPTPTKRASLPRTPTQAHTNPFEGERQRAAAPLQGIRMVAPQPKKVDVAEGAKHFAAAKTDPMALGGGNASGAALASRRPSWTLLVRDIPYATKATLALPAAPLTLQRKRVNSAPAGVRSVLDPSCLPTAAKVSTGQHPPKPSLQGIFDDGVARRAPPAVSATPFARNTPRSMTPTAVTEGRRHLGSKDAALAVRAPYSTNTPRAVTPPPSSRASSARAPYSTGSTPRLAQPVAAHRVQAPFHSSTPRAPSPGSSYRPAAPFA